jgi:hypothetical protein
VLRGHDPGCSRTGAASTADNAHGQGSPEAEAVNRKFLVSGGSYTDEYMNCVGGDSTYDC